MLPYQKITGMLSIAALLLCSACTLLNSLPLLNRSPIINSLTAEKEIRTSSETQIVCKANDPDGDNVTYQWSTEGGSITGEGSAVTWTAPAISDNYTIQVTASDGKGGIVTQSIEIAVIVKHPSVAPYQRPPSDEFIKITAPLTVGEAPSPGEPDVYNGYATYIPYGSVVYHWSNGITEVFGPDKKRIFIARDSEAAMIPHSTPPGASRPGGSPATRSYQVPSGTLISSGVCLLDGKVILDVIHRPEPY
jgi:hypothetical protein